MAEETTSTIEGAPGAPGSPSPTPVQATTTPATGNHPFSSAGAEAPSGLDQTEDASSGSNGGEGAAEVAKDKAQGLASRVTEQVDSQIDQRSTEYGERVSSAVSDLRGVGEHLQGQDNEQAARAANSAADQAERLASYLQDANGQKLLNDVEDIGRRQPWLVLAGGVAAGIAAARLLKASSSDRYEHRQSSAAGPAA